MKYESLIAAYAILAHTYAKIKNQLKNDTKIKAAKKRYLDRSNFI